MDILNIRLTSREIEIVHPGTKAPTGLKLEIVSLADPRPRAAQRLVANAAAAANLRTAEESDADALRILASTVIGWTWSGEANLGGDKKPPMTEPNKMRVLGLRWVARQVDEALGHEAAFYTDVAA